MPAVAAKIPSFKLSLGFIIPDLYANNNDNSIKAVRQTALKTIPQIAEHILKKFHLKINLDIKHKLEL